MKRKIFLLLAIIVLLIGCGKTNQGVSDQNRFSEQVKSCLLESEFTDNTNVWNKLNGYRRTIQLLLDHQDEHKWMSEVSFIEDEKGPDYTVTCVNEMYDMVKRYLSAENMINLQVYMPALRGETDFYYTHFGLADNINEIGETEITSSVWNAYCYMEKITMEDYYRVKEISYNNYFYNWMNRATLVDLDGDGEKELIIRLIKEEFDKGYMVLHEENGKIYLIDFPVDRFQNLQENGIYIGGARIGRTSYCHLIFQDEMLIEEELAGWDGENAYINGQEVSEDELEEWKAAHMVKGARWYDAADGYLPHFSSYYQLRVFAENYPNWMPDKGSDYSYCVYDFNQDGCLELLVTIKKVDGIENHFYQIVWGLNGDEIQEMKQDYNGEGEEFDICNETLAAFYDKDEGVIYYRNWNSESNSDVEDRNYFYIKNRRVFYARMDSAEVEESEKIKRIVKPESVPRSVGNQVMGCKRVMLYLITSYRKGVY